MLPKEVLPSEEIGDLIRSLALWALLEFIFAPWAKRYQV